MAHRNSVVKAELTDLQRELGGVVKWFELGVQLGVPTDRLRAIRVDCHYQTDDCRLQMLIRWGQIETPSWTKVINGLRVIGRETLADEIERKYIFGGQSHTHLPAVTQPMATASNGGTSTAPTKIRLTMGKLTLIKYTDSQGKKKSISVVTSIMNDWKKVARLLDIPGAEINSIATVRRDNPHECCCDVFTKWFEQGSDTYPLSWEGVIELLSDIKHGQLAKELKQVLSRS